MRQLLHSQTTGRMTLPSEVHAHSRELFPERTRLGRRLGEVLNAPRSSRIYVKNKNDSHSDGSLSRGDIRAPTKRIWLCSVHDNSSFVRTVVLLHKKTF
jgi:hypothetical protein